MISHLYRFRPLHAVLSSYNELQNQEIYFASLAELNDPMEGFRDIFWQGDEIVWENLFRHYVLCLERACDLLAFLGEGQPFGWSHIPVVQLDDPSITPQQKARHDAILEAFFGEDTVRSYIKALSSRTQPIRRSELRAHIQPLHLFAISVIYASYERLGRTPKQPIIAELIKNSKKSLSQAAKRIPLIERLEIEHPDLEYATDALFTFNTMLNDQLRLINYYNGIVEVTKANNHFVFVEFCDGYVKEIEKLICPTWYTACFMEDCRDSSVWGSYGDKHTGVCLKFKVASGGGDPTIKLNRINAISGDRVLSQNVEHPFHKVEYTKDHVQVDFFKSLNLPMPTLKRFWYSDRNGNVSPCGNAIFSQTVGRREQYWKDIHSGISRKLEAWSREQEYRLILWGDMLDFSSKDSRKAKYDFYDLDGIIFGINTPVKKKLEIFRIVEEKCRKSGRTKFTFYQAYYSRQKGTIEHHEMRLLKFQLD